MTAGPSGPVLLWSTLWAAPMGVEVFDDLSGALAAVTELRMRAAGAA